MLFSSFFEYFQVKEKKYETVGTTSQMLAASLRIMGASHVNMQPFKNPIRSTSIMSSMARKSSTDNTTQQKQQNQENQNNQDQNNQQNTTLITSSNAKLNRDSIVSNPNPALQGSSPASNSNSNSPIISPHETQKLFKIGGNGLPITSNGGQRIATDQIVENSNSFTDHSEFLFKFSIMCGSEDREGVTDHFLTIFTVQLAVLSFEYC